MTRYADTRPVEWPTDSKQRTEGSLLEEPATEDIFATSDITMSDHETAPPAASQPHAEESGTSGDDLTAAPQQEMTPPFPWLVNIRLYLLENWAPEERDCHEAGQARSTASNPCGHCQAEKN
jgi:hypothetical protein